jgi:hypothetical protein
VRLSLCRSAKEGVAHMANVVDMLCEIGETQSVIGRPYRKIHRSDAEVASPCLLKIQCGFTSLVAMQKMDLTRKLVTDFISYFRFIY